MTDLDDDIRTAREWWSTVAPSADDRVRGLWFGLFVEPRTDGTRAHTMYVAGAPTFHHDDGGDWACEHIWFPEGRYVRLDGLARIPTADWQGAVDHAIRVVETLAPWEDHRFANLLGAGVGFDDGDAKTVWGAPASEP